MTTDTLLDQDETIALTNWHMEQNQLDKALLTLKPLLSKDDLSIGTYVLAGRLYAQLGLFKKAELLFATYLEQEPKDDQVMFQLGMTQFDSNKTTEALETWVNILTDQPNNPPALFYSALAHLRLDNKETAIVQLQTILTSVHSDNLYFNKAKELIGNLERDPSFRGAANKVNAQDNELANKEIYTTQH